MPDLEQRLRDDAGRADDIAPPSLDAALTGALTRRSPAVGWLAAAAVLMVLAGVTVVLTLHSGGRDRAVPASVPSISGVPQHRGDLVLTRVSDAGVDVVFLVPGDNRALDVLVPYSRQQGGCSLYRPEVDVLAQAGSGVRLRASGYEYASKPNKGGYAGFSCNQDKTRPVRVRLDAPVGSRAVYGSATGHRAVRVIDPFDAPRPSYLPPGYDAWHTTLPDARTGVLSAERVYLRDSSTITVDTGDSTTDLPQVEGPVTGYADVHGARARVIDHGDIRCVGWQVSGGRAREVCSDGPVLVSPGEVLKIARSLR